jgi:hypothetical protein
MSQDQEQKAPRTRSIARQLAREVSLEELDSIAAGNGPDSRSGACCCCDDSSL